MSLARAVRVDARVRGDIIVMADLRVEPEADGDYRILHTGLFRKWNSSRGRGGCEIKALRP